MVYHPFKNRKEHFAAMKRAFPRVFDVTSTLRKMTIQLTDDAQPAVISTARSIPFCWHGDIRRQLGEVLEKDVIEPVEHPTEWFHPIIPVAKRSPDAGRHCLRLPPDCGFHQAEPLRQEAGVPSQVAARRRGFDRQRREVLHKAGQQVRLSPDPYLRRRPGQDLLHHALGSLPLQARRYGSNFVRRRVQPQGGRCSRRHSRTCKVVDYVLAYDSSYSAYLQHVWDVLKRCDDHEMTLNPDKCSFSEEEVEFCGYKTGQAGYTADDKKVRAIAEFTQPSCITDLRSFLGLVNQLGDFARDVSVAAEPLRHLLRPKNTWLWTSLHSKAFSNVKKTLVSPPILDFFDPRRRTILETDAARLRGLGFCLRQQDEDGRWRLIQCGSRFLSDVESRYATCELEMLAVTWDCRKCSLYLSGMQQFEVITDHRPLVPILNSKSLQDTENPRLQRLRERLTFYFVTSWRQGKMNAIPDTLSRSPVDPPTQEDEEAEKGWLIRVPA